MFHWYGMIVGIGAAAVWWVAERKEPAVNQVIWWILAGAIFGARAYHVIDKWSYYREHLVEVFFLWNGGLAIWGAVAGAAVVLVLRERQKFWEIAGAIATALPLGQAIGRWGNAVNGEFVNFVFGVPWWLAESLLDTILFGVLWKKRFRGKKAVGAYLLGYGAIRGVLEWGRMGNWWAGGLPVAVAVSAVSIVLGEFLLLTPDTP